MPALNYTWSSKTRPNSHRGSKLLFSSLLTTLLMLISSSSFAITGTPVVCVGSTTALTDAGSGGVWSSSNGGVAVVGTSGIVTGVSPGTATI